MRRMMLLVAGLGTGGFLFYLLCSGAAAQYVSARTLETAASCVSLPCPVEDTFLVALELAIYEGPFREDGTDEEVAGVAALVVENAGGNLVSEGAVVLEWGEDRLVFELSALPPGERVLILEKDKKTYRGQQLLGCYGWTREEYPEDPGFVAVEEYGGNGLLVTNRTNDTAPMVSIRFKSHDADSGMYIGGICYTVTVSDLQPGEKRVIKPYHYARGCSKVVCVTTETEEITQSDK